jgi:hypothetical protein
LTRGRLTLIAHSGGGAGVSALLDKGLNPDEVICFDSMYGGEEPIRKWAEVRIASAQASQSGLRVFYLACSGPLKDHPAGRWVPQTKGEPLYEDPGSWSYWTSDNRWHLGSTEVSARRLQFRLDHAIAKATAGGALAARFRVERTSVRHGQIPARYGPLLLENIAASVPNAEAPPPATTGPACVANSNWLTDPPQKPGGDDPPPSKPQ